MAAAFLAASLAALLPGRAAACQFASLPTVEEAAADRHVIFIAKVVEIPRDRAYVLDVSRVFRGQVPDALTIAQPRGDVSSSCDAHPQLGATYLFMLDSLDQRYLGLFDVPIRIQGDQLVDRRLDAGDLDRAGLIALLKGLPDTSMAPRAGSGSPLTAIGAAVVLLGLILAARRRLSHV
jgi:hypothetical protein